MKNLLLTTASNQQIAPYIIGAAIIIIGVALVINHLRTKKGKAEIESFISEISDAVLTEIVNFLNGLDLKKVIGDADSLAAVEATLIAEIYEKVWELVQKHLDEAYADNPLYNIMKANLTKENVKTLSEWLVNSKPVQAILSDNIAAAYNSDSADKLEEEYEEINKQIEDDTYAEGEEVPEINLQEAMPDLEPIIPPSEDGNSIDEDVDEIVGEKTETVGLGQLSEAISNDDDE